MMWHKTRKCINAEWNIQLTPCFYPWTLPVTSTPITELRIIRGFKQAAPVHITILMTFVTSTRTEHTSKGEKKLHNCKMNVVIKGIPTWMTCVNVNKKMCLPTKKNSTEMPLLLAVQLVNVFKKKSKHDVRLSLIRKQISIKKKSSWLPLLLVVVM